MKLFHFAVPVLDASVLMHAVVADTDEAIALKRLQQDDPLWLRDEVKFLGGMPLDRLMLFRGDYK